MTKILFLTHSPIGDFSFGGSQRANHLRDALMANAEVHTLIINGGKVFTTDDVWSDEQVREGKVSVYGLSIEALRQRLALSRWIKYILEETHYDFVVAQYLDLALLVPKRWRSRMIFDPDDFMKTSAPGAFSSNLSRIKLRVRNTLAQRVARQALHVWYASPRVEHLPDNARRSFMPNVVAVPDRSRSLSTPSAQRLLMVGLFAHAPNVEGLTWFADNVWQGIIDRFPSAEMHVIGRHDLHLPERFPSFRFHGYVEDLAVEYERAAVVVAPIRSGGGTQIKVIDALVHERPLVSSAFAHSGFAEDLIDGEHLLVADEPKDWIGACSQLLKNPDEAERIARQGRSRAAAAYGPERMVEEVRATLASLSSTTQSIETV